MKNDLIVGLDIGTTKVCAVVGEMSDDRVNIVGLGSHPSVGLRKGVVVSIEDTVDSIRRAVSEAELMAGCEITQVYAGIAGGHIKGFNSIGVIAIKSKEVTQADVDRVLDTARAVAIPMDREVIHIIPQEFIVDEEDGIKDPIGISGVRLEARVHIVTAAATSAHNIIKCANRAGLDVCDIVLEPIASSEAVLSKEERGLGVGLIDFGGGTTDLAIFSGESVRHTSVLALGGNNLTHDIAVGLRTPEAEAEVIKKKYGCALSTMISKDEILEVPGAGDGRNRKVSRRILGEILEPRVEEIFTLIQREMIRSGYEDMPVSGMVLTGGSSLLPGILEVAEQVFNLPVRCGYPVSVGGLVDIVNNPMYATGVGLVLYGKKSKPTRKFRIRDKNIFNRVLARMKRWFQEVI
jgi:cell division protein FtsA